MIGVNLLPGGSGGVGGPLQPTPTPRALGPQDVGGRISAGTYHVAAPFALGFSVTVPEGSTLEALADGEVGFRLPAADLVLGLYVPVATYPDPCRAEGSPAPVPTTPDGIVAAISGMAGFKAESVSDVTLDGHAGKALILSNSVDTATQACAFGPMLPVFTYRGSDPQGAATNGGLTESFWVIDVQGTPVVVARSSPAPGVPADAADQIDQVLQSIDFDD